MDRKQFYYKIGRKYGYPVCCIKSFVNGRTFATMSKADIKKHEASVLRYSGFIPCEKCNKLDPHILIRKIRKRRMRVFKPFPHEHNFIVVKIRKKLHVKRRRNAGRDTAI